MSTKEYVTNFEMSDGSIKWVKDLNVPLNVVDANGNGMYRTIDEAIADSDGETLELFVKNGLYSGHYSLTNFKTVIIIGESKNAIIQYNGGKYSESTISLNQNFLLENLTIKALANDAFVPTFDGSNVEQTFPAYALHIDTQQDDGGFTGTIQNCKIESTAGSCIGSGTQPNSNLKIIDCEINRYSPTNYLANDPNYDSALLIHCATTSGVANQHAYVINNIVTNTTYPSATFRGELVSSSGFTLHAFNNIFELEGETRDGVYYNQSNSNLYGANNNAFALNNLPSAKGSVKTYGTVLNAGSVKVSDINWKYAKYVSIDIRRNQDYESYGGLTVNVGEALLKINSNLGNLWTCYVYDPNVTNCFMTLKLNSDGTFEINSNSTSWSAIDITLTK